MIQILRWTAMVLVSLGALWGCASTTPSSGDSETHWLKSCTGDVECGGAALCECGLCTIACVPTEPSSCKLGPPGSACVVGASASACAGTASPPQGLCLGAAGKEQNANEAGTPDATPVPVLDGGRTLTFSATVVDNTTNPQGPLGDVKVCIVDLAGNQNPTIPCVTTSSQGGFALGGLPRNTELIARFTKPGYDPLIKALDAKETDLAPLAEFIGMDDVYTKGKGWTSRGPNSARGLPVPADPKGGNIVFFSTEPGTQDGSIANTSFHLAVGVTVTISPAAGDGPYYFNPGGNGEPDLDAGSDRGVGGIFVNLPPGEYTLTFHHPTRQCFASAPVYGYPAGPNALRAPVMAGTWTDAVGVTCF